VNPGSFITNFTSTKRNTYIYIVLGVVFGVVALPVVALASVTNLAVLGSNGNVSLYADPAVAGDTYDYGYCTYWAALRRIQIGDPTPNGWGDAIDWANQAQQAGYVVDQIPSYGAIMQDPNALGGEGHVAFVESVDSVTGSWTISEMNAVGWDEVDEKTMSAVDALKYNFIHDKLPTSWQF
jgi:surface antigen